MHLELKDFKDNCLQQELVFTSADFPVLAQMQEQVAFTAPIVFRLRFQKTGQLIEVDGELQTSVSLGCGRCLQRYEKQLSGDFAFTFTPFVAADLSVEEEDAEIELETDELGLVFYRDETLELQQPLQDQLVMVLPISSVCSDECLGLCPDCGCNLNVEKCDCEKKIFNSKFSALAGLKIESSDQ